MKEQKFRVIGYDQGLANAGICVVEYKKKGSKLTKKLLFKQHFRTYPKEEKYIRVSKHYDNLKMLVEKYKPDAIGCEIINFTSMVGGVRNKSAQMLNVNIISGVVMIIASKYNLEYHEYVPGTIKKFITGNGRATKDDMISAVKKDLKIEENIVEHIADAIAIANITAHNYYKNTDSKAK